MRTNSKTRIWEKKYPQKPDYFNFTDFTIGLNNLTHELFDRVPTTDTRLRPDIRALENGLMDVAESERTRLYKKEKEIK
jgi:hypothetical protein